MGFTTGFCCVRCGHVREEHNPNLVNEPDEIFLPAEKKLRGYKMSLVDCVETKLPDEYLAIIEADELCIDEHSSRYVSPDPHSEHRLREQYLGTFAQHTIVMIPDKRRGCYLIFSSE